MILNDKLSVNCTWDAWGAWETCSLTCGGGTQVRNRAVDQETLFGGNECTGDHNETQSCNSNGCPGIYVSVLYNTNTILICQ